MVNCCVPLCENYSSHTKKLRGDGENLISYHEFPCDFALRQKWMKAVSRKDYVINDKSNTSRVCRDHFKEEDFTPGKKRRRLKPGSVPSVFQGYPSYLQPSTSSTRNLPKKRKLEEDLPLLDAASILLNLSKAKPAQCPLIKDSCDLEIELKRKENLLVEANKKLNQKILEVKRLKKQLYDNRKIMQSLTSRVHKASTDINVYENSVHHQNLEQLLIFEDCDCANTRETFLLTQIKYKNNKKCRWSEKVLRECVLLHAVSPRGYRTLLQRKLVLLPSIRTLKRYTGPIINETGVSSLIKCRLEEEVASLKPEEKFCSLIIDEVALKPQLIYDKQMDCFLGGKSNDEDNKKMKVANRMLCFLLYGLSTKISIPCAYYFTSHLTGKELHKLCCDVLTQVEECGFKVVRFVADNHKTNVSMFKCFNNGKLSHKITHPCDPTRTLFFSFDQNHIIKNIRSLFLSNDMTDGSGTISGKFLKELYKLQNTEKIKAVRNLTLKHVDPTNLEKMNVGRAVLIFSPPVTAALKFLKDNANRDARARTFIDCNATVQFLENVYEWYSIHDICNRSQHQYSRNPSKRHFFSCSDERLEWLMDVFLPYLSSIEKACRSNDPPLKFLSNETYAALKLTTHSTIDCIRYLLENGFQYVLTRYFNSDAIESFFGSLRQMSGNNDMLDVRATIFAMDKILKTGLVSTSKYSSVGVMKFDLFRSRIIARNGDDKKDSFTLPDDVMHILNSIANIKRPPITLKSASIAYVAGYIVRTMESEFSCNNCVQEFSSPHCNSPLLNLISNQDRGGLMYPSNSFVYTLEILLHFVEKAVPFLPVKNISFNLQKIIFPEFLKSPIIKCHIPDHPDALVSFVCKKFLSIVLKNIANSIYGRAKDIKKPLCRKVLKLF